jgi:hypothetical protein
MGLGRIPVDTGIEDISPIVQRVYNEAQAQGFGVYAKPITRAVFPDYLRKPGAPGDSAYPSPLDVTAYRITGSDPGVHVRRKDVPQAVIDAHHRAFLAGLILFFPDDAIKRYMIEKLAAPAFDQNREWAEADYSGMIFEHYPRTSEALKLKQNQFGLRSLRSSIEHDFLPSSAFTGAIHASSRIQKDRKVLSNEDEAII